jgi:non-ribosomal peptide synthase protein (TIGR01720 family)
MTTDIGADLAGLTAEQRQELLRRLRRRRSQAGRAVGTAGHTVPVAVAEPVEGPLATAQERLWFVDRLDPGNPAYAIPFSLRITGPLDHAALECAVDEVVRRHDALRAVFPVRNGEPRQLVRPVLRVPVPLTDLCTLPAQEREAEARRLATAHAQHRFDLATGPLLAVRLLRLDTDLHLLLASVHHIVFDGWSTAIFIAELAAHYRAGTTGEPASVPPLPTSYSSWADQERAEAAGAAVAAELDHWRRRFVDAPALSTFPTDLPRPARQRHRGAQRALPVPAEPAARLAGFARGQGTTLNVVMLAGFAALLRQASGQDDLLIGTPVAGRTRADLEPLIGCFANTLVLRIDLRGDPSTRTLLSRVHESVREAYAHQRAPYATVVEAVAPPRDPAHNPLFQIMFSVAAIATEPHRAGAVTFTPEPVETGSTDFDLFCTFTHHGDTLDGVMSYDADLLLPATVDGIGERLVAVLADMVASPDTAIGELPSLRRHRIAIAASFTADPIREPIGFWFDFLRLPVDLRIAPYGQVLPELLGGGPDDAVVCLIRWEDWLRHREVADLDAAAAFLDGVADDLDMALRAFRARSDAPLVVGVCPPSERFGRHPWARLLARLDERLAAACRRLAHVTMVPPEAWTRRYPVGTVSDPAADSLGHVPYTPAFFAVLGTCLARLLARTWAPEIRWVALDGTVAPGGVAALPERIAAQAGYGRQVVVAGAGEDLVGRMATAVAAGPSDPAGCLVLTADPVTAQRVRSRFPAATVVTVPVAAARPGGETEPARFLDHLWPLDPATRTGDGPAALFDPARLSHLATRLRTAQSVLERCRPPARAVPAPDRPATPPRTATERRLATIWAQLVPATAPDVRQDFFAAGGHSLLAVQLLSRVESEFGRHVPLHVFFANPTIDRLAAAVDEAAGTPEEIPLVPRDGELALSSTQRRMWTIARLGDDPLRHNVTFAAVLRGSLDVAGLRRAVDGIVRRHEILRATFPDRDGTPVLVVRDRMDCWLPARDLTGVPEPLPDQAFEAEIERHARHQCDLATGPMLWVRLLVTGPDEHRLLVGMHHIVSDNWSWTIFLRELATCYQALAKGEQPELPPLPIQFADFAAWQASRIDVAASRHADYWRSRLAGAPALLDLPTDWPRPAVRSDRAGRASRSLAEPVGERLRQVAAAEGATPFAAILAGYAVLLGHLAGQDDLVLGTPVTGRDRPELAELIGYFADLLVLRLDLAGEPTFRELIGRCHAVATEAYAHQELPFGEVVDAFRPARDPAYHPIFQCVINVVDGATAPPGLSGVTMEPVEVPPTGTDFDLFLTLTWQEGQLHAILDYRADLYRPETADQLLAGLEAVLEAGSSDPDQPVGELRLGSLQPASRHHSQPAGAGPAPVAGAFPVSVAASFTAQPVRDGVRFWLDRIDLPASLEFGPYGQVFQQLLDRDGGFGVNPDGVAVVLVRWEDWLRRQDHGPQRLPEVAAVLDSLLQELARAVRAFRLRTASPLVIAVCPASDRFRRPPWSSLFAGLADRLAHALAGARDVRVARFDAMVHRYPVADLDDPLADELGHVPYTPAGYSVLGTLLAGEVHRWRGRPVETVLVEPALARPERPALLRLLHRQRRAGRRVVAGPAARAGEGCLALVADATAVDRVRAEYPGALVVTVPEDPAAVPGLLDHAWTGVPGGPDPVTDPAEALRLVAASSRVPGAGQGAPPRTERERALAGIWADLLHLERVGVDEPFWGLGGDSMVAIQVVSRAARAGIAITPRQLLEHPTIEALAAAATEAAAGGEDGVGDPERGDAPLTGAQRWFFEELAPSLPRPDHFNHPYDLTLLRPVDPRDLAAALTLLATHHGALRLRFTRAGTGWRQAYAEAGEPVPFASHDLTGLPTAAQDERITELAGEHQAGLDLTAGPLVRAVHFRLGPDRPDRLLIVNHHLVVDAISRGLLLEDLETLCAQLAAAGSAWLPARTTSYRAWAEQLDQLVHDGRFDGELELWRGQGAPPAPLPVDHPGGVATYGSAEVVRTALTEPATAAVRRAARRLGLAVSDLLLAATAGVIADWTGQAECGLAVAGHGRPDLLPDLDLSRTVGWFQVYYPLRLWLAGSPGLSLVTAVREQVARVPHTGIGYGLLRYAHPDPAVRVQLAELPAPQVTFNYMGDFGFAGTPHRSGLFGPSPELAGTPQDERGRWPYLLDVVPSVTGGRLLVELNYSHHVHRRETVARVASDLVARLAQLVREAGEPDLTDPVTEGSQPHAG